MLKMFDVLEFLEYESPLLLVELVGMQPFYQHPVTS